ncbi:AI-2E family transporter [Bilifractor sp. HCP3S3_D3]|uniref:AI-2E family transporter n=1 Tax=unclassified Bilifractor TaxID=2815795 RepID=UPI003F8A65C6
MEEKKKQASVTEEKEGRNPSPPEGTAENPGNSGGKAENHGNSGGKAENPGNSGDAAGNPKNPGGKAENPGNSGDAAENPGNPGRNAESGEEKKPSKRRMRDNFRPEYTRISFYVVITVMIIYFLIRMFDHVGNIAGAIGSGFRWLGVIIRPLVLGLVFAYLLYPMVNFFERHIDALRDRFSSWRSAGGTNVKPENPGIAEKAEHSGPAEQTDKTGYLGKTRSGRKRKSSRGLAVAITCVIVAVILFVILSLIVSTITSQLSVISLSSFDTIINGFIDTLNELARNIESVLHRLNISSDQINSFINQAGDSLSESIEKIASNLIVGIKNLPSFFSMLLFAIIFGIYFMVDGEGLKKYWGHVFRTIAGKKGRKYLEEFASEADRVFSGYIRGQLMDALFMSVAVSITLSVIGVKYSIIIGVLTGIGNLIPYVGPFVAYGSTAVVCLLNWNMKRFVVAMAVLFILQTIDGNVVNPKLLGNSIRIHPVLVIVSLLIGGKIGGLLGMIIAVPCGGLLKVYFEKLIAYLANRKRTAAMKQEEQKNAEKSH